MDLAVRGKLVEQNAHDEPAEELLTRIEAEKAALMNAGKLRRDITVREVLESETLFPLPRGWKRVPLGQIVISRDGERVPVSKEERNRRSKRYDYYGASGVIDKIDDYLFDKALLLIGEDGANLINRSTPIAFIARGRYWVNNHAHVLDGTSEAFLRFIELHINAIDLRPYVTGTAQPKMNQAKMNGIPIALPPEAEQHRIVAKVDELMALCDQLEAAKAERERSRDRLVAASLHRLYQSSDNAETEDPEAFRAHASFTLDNLARVSGNASDIPKIKDTILQLAVTGRLSEERRADGDATLLLKTLNGGRSARRKKAIADAPVSVEPLPTLPSSWRWAIIDQVAAEEENAITDGPFGASLKTTHYIDTPGYRIIRLQNVARGKFRAEHRSYVDAERFWHLAKHHVFPGDLVVAGLVDPFVRCCQVPDDIGPALVKADCYRFKVHPEFSARFALYYLNSPLCQRFAAVHHHGMTLVRIGLGNFRSIPIPVPPLAEQHRIVAKVDELMALCDQLEAQLITTESDSRRLLEAVLHEALAPAAEKVA